jgi:adenylate cyclase
VEADVRSLLRELKRRRVFRVVLAYLVVAFGVLQGADVLTEALALPDWALTLVAVLIILGFPVAVVLAWAFDVTPDGVRRAGPPVSAAPLRLGAAGVLLLATLLAGGWWLSSDRVRIPLAEAGAGDAAAAGDAASIAVLPFVDMSPDGDQAWFADGISEEVLNVLVGVQGLSVASRTSSFQFRSKESLGIPAIAEMLKVRHVLEGSVRRAGDRIRITAQLIDGSRDAHLWSETFDRTLTTENLFEIQDEIARAIVEAIDRNLGMQVGAVAPVPQRTGNVDAYALYLQARPRYYAREDLKSVDNLLERALEIDPAFGDALAMRASVAMLSSDYDQPLWGSREASRDRARQFAAQALAATPKHGLALGVLAHLQSRQLTEGEVGGPSLTEVSQGYDAAVAIEPNNADLLNWRGRWKGYIGRFAEAESDFRHCREVEPAYAPCRLNLVHVLIVQGRRDEAAGELLASAASGAMMSAPINLIVLRELDMRETFYVYGASMPRLRGWNDFAALYEAFGKPDVDHRVLRDRLVTLLGSDSDAVTVEVRLLLIALGDHRTSAENLFIWLPVMATHRQSPAFKASVIRSGRLRYWQAEGFPAQCRPVGREDFTCD